MIFILAYEELEYFIVFFPRKQSARQPGQTAQRLQHLGIELNISLVTVVQAPRIDYRLHTHLNVLTKKK